MSLLFCERADDLRGDVKEEDGGDEREGQHEDDERVTGRRCQREQLHGPSENNRIIENGVKDAS